MEKRIEFGPSDKGLPPEFAFNVLVVFGLLSI
jgi:hypothetical protein